MLNYPIFLMFLVILATSGCGKFDVINRPAPELLQAETVCIIDDPETREGFKKAMQNWLNKENIKNQIVPASSKVDSCAWTMRYYGRWSWDLALFLSDAEITAYKNGIEAGEVNLRVGQWDSHKFEDGDNRIYKMMDMLSGKVDRYILTNPKKKKSD
ncbi:Sbal_3080 family lipoprotein [Maridesulfovibrio sp. FT414]|uniref:Sbal_3080 family lipoprotein n=1 Tax=Maridesulfovibrio sp. FT414 TaxID=2979469 RepID=UPI003D803C05